MYNYIIYKNLFHVMIIKKHIKKNVSIYKVML